MEEMDECEVHQMQVDCLFCKESIQITCGPKGHICIVVPKETKVPVQNNGASPDDQICRIDGVSNFEQCEGSGDDKYIGQLTTNAVTFEDLFKAEETGAKGKTVFLIDAAMLEEHVYGGEHKSQRNKTAINIHHNLNGQCGPPGLETVEEGVTLYDSADNNATELTVGAHLIVEQQLSSTKSEGCNNFFRKSDVAQTTGTGSKILLQNDVNKHAKEYSDEIKPCKVYLNDFVKEKHSGKNSNEYTDIGRKQNRSITTGVVKDHIHPQRKAVKTTVSSTGNSSQMHDRKIYVCNTCNKQFSCKRNMKRHHEAVHEQVKHKCKFCSKAFIRLDWLKIHMKRLCLVRSKSEESLNPMVASSKGEAEPMANRPIATSTSSKGEAETTAKNPMAASSKGGAESMVKNPMAASSKGEAESTAKNPMAASSKGEAESTAKNPMAASSKGEAESMAKIAQNEEIKTMSLHQETKNNTKLRVESSTETKLEYDRCVCDRCDSVFKTQSKLHYHIRTVHDTTEFICEECGRACIGKDRYRQHRRVHRDTRQRMIECELCHEICSSKFRLEKHKENKHNIPMAKEPRVFCCEKCGRFYKTKDSLRKHVKYMHTRIVKSAKRVKRRKPVTTCPEEKRKEEKVCDICGETLNELNYKRHMRQVHLLRERTCSCEICGKSFFGGKELRLHKIGVHFPKNFQCDICKKLFSFKSGLSIHQRFVHRKERPHKCDICSKSFIQAHKLKVHMRLHTGERPFVCEVCGKGYISTSNLIRHKETHSGHKRFPCQFCPSRFWQKKDRDEHEQRHTGQWKHKCQQCGKGFSLERALRLHEKMRGVHTSRSRVYTPRTSPRQPSNKYICSTCGKGYASTSGLYMHEKLHSGVKPFACTVCDRRFVYKNSLNYHMVTHTKEKPYQCSMCDSRFSFLANKNRHENTVHLGIKLFSCDECGKSFGQKTQVTAHKKIHTKRKTVDVPVPKFEESSLMNFKVEIL